MAFFRLLRCSLRFHPEALIGDRLQTAYVPYEEHKIDLGHLYIRNPHAFCIGGDKVCSCLEAISLGGVNMGPFWGASNNGLRIYFYAVGFSLMLGNLFKVVLSFNASRVGMVLEFMLGFLHLCWVCVVLCCCVVESSPPWLLLMLRVFF